MSHPREIVVGATYLITRRTLRRYMLLRPDSAITQIILYLLAVSASRFGVQVHALCAMSTHLHLVVTDVQGELPRFLQYFHRLVALTTKVLRKWEGPVWDHEPVSVVQLLTKDAIIEKIAYTLANPVVAGLVRYARDWPGAKVCVGDLGRGELRATRPQVYLDPNNPQWPEGASLPITLPPSIDDAKAFREQVAAELQQQEWKARAEIQGRGRGFLGADRASKVCPEDRATSFEPLRSRNPTFAVGRGHTEEGKSASAAVRAFRQLYRAALNQWRAGVRNVVFPAATWWMRVFHGVVVDARIPWHSNAIAT